MAKDGRSSWLAAFKRAFRSSPTKDSNTEQEDKKREKKKWVFRKSPAGEHPLRTLLATSAAPAPAGLTLSVSAEQRRRAIAVAVATAATAEAAACAAKAAAAVVRLTSSSASLVKEDAAIVIQTAFRGYLIWRDRTGFVEFEEEAEQRDRRTRRRASTGQRDPIKTLEVDTGSRHHQASLSPSTPSPSSARSLQMRSAPNYMAATESAMARFRPQSAPRQRTMTPEREGMMSAARKKLLFDPYDDNDGLSGRLQSPSFKREKGLRMAAEQRSKSAAAAKLLEESAGGECFSPAAPGGTRRWFR